MPDQTPYEMVKEFHEDFGATIGENPRDNIDDEELMKARIEWMREELEEYIIAATGRETVVLIEQNPSVACKSPDIIEMADGLGDLLYFVIGTAICFGIDLEAVVAEIHDSNMKKKQPDGTVERNHMGKVVKPASWEPPNIQKVLGVNKYGVKV